MSSSLVSRIGRSVLPFTNSRVVAPPGLPGHYGRPNLIVATPMRSGTHILIDLLLNNLPAYRTRPLYVDLNKCLRYTARGRDLLGPLRHDAGHVIKTHYPVGVPPMTTDPRLDGLIRAGLVLVVHRPRTEILRSLDRWVGVDGVDPETRFGTQIEAFWNFWDGYDRIDIDFADLFRPDPMQALLQRVAAWSGVEPRARFVPPPARTEVRRIYLDKAATRLLGARAPRINTTIHTLKD